MSSNRTEEINIRLKPEVFEKLEKLCDEYGITKTDLIEVLLLNGVPIIKNCRHMKTWRLVITCRKYPYQTRYLDECAYCEYFKIKSSGGS